MLRVGVFDSGLGGLTVVQSILETIKGIELFYIADTFHAPYGEKTTEEILQYSLEITQYFIDTYNIDALVVACNTATSAAIEALRVKYPDLILVGTEPAIKPAIEQTRSGHVGVLATPATLRGDKYQALAEKLSNTKEVVLYEQACPGLVEHIEQGSLESAESIALLKQWLLPMKRAGVDTIVLGCTHYPLAAKTIASIMDDNVKLMDSGRAIALRLQTLLEEKDDSNDSALHLTLYATGAIDEALVYRLVKQPIEIIAL